MKKIFQILLFWLMIIATTLLPLSLSRLGVDLYLLPQIEIGVAFFLSIYANIYPIQLFLYGLLIDVAYGTQIGVSAFILLIINKIIVRFKSNLAKQNMKALLLYFAFTYLLTSIFKYIVFSFESGLYVGSHLTLLAINDLVNIAFYPLIHYLMLYSPYTNHLQTKL